MVCAYIVSERVYFLLLLFLVEEAIKDASYRCLIVVVAIYSPPSRLAYIKQPIASDPYANENLIYKCGCSKMKQVQVQIY